MPPQNAFLRRLHSAAGKVPPLMNAYRRLRDFSKRDPWVGATYRKVFERGRLRLPTLDPEQVSPSSESIVMPCIYPLFAGEDAFLNDLLFLLNAARGRRARRILEVGTYRARTTYALCLNCPEAVVVSYDIMIHESEYRRRLEGRKNVFLRQAPFASAGKELRKEPAYDLIFIDGSHRFDAVLDDSRLALEVLAPNGVIVWHDYRLNDYFNRELQVPEALEVLRQTVPVYGVKNTLCAVHLQGGIDGSKA